MASRKVRVIGAFHHRAKKIDYATLRHGGCLAASLHRGLRAFFELRSIVAVFLLLATMRELIAHCGCRAALIPVPDALIQSFNLLTLQGPFGKTVR